MSKHYTGGCACGAVRYEISSEPIYQHHCHCSECQKLSGTGHGSYLTFASRAQAAITGEVGSWRVRGDKGTQKQHAFCASCGSPVYLLVPERPELVVVHAASLDEPDRFVPQAATFAASAPPWDRPDASLQVFDGMPQG